MSEDFVYPHPDPHVPRRLAGRDTGHTGCRGVTTSVPLFSPEAVLDAIERD